MTGQESIPVPQAPARGACAWCGTTTSKKLTLAPPRRTSKGGVTRIIKPAQEVWCCDDHLRSLELKKDADE